jgi:SAM-dependent methyltransferase
VQTTTISERAQQWGSLWGARPADWDLSETQQIRTYEQALRRVSIEPGSQVLDVGCGTGVFLRAAADLGAEVSGLDASEPLLARAAERVPEADLTLGEMEALPYADDRFDLVTGFNSFFFATDMTAALREAGRVAKAGAEVVIQVWGRHERCDLEAMKEIVRPYMPPRPPDAPPEPELWKPGVLEDLAEAAGLTPDVRFEASWAFEYQDAETLGRAMLAPAGIAVLVEGHEDDVRAAIVEALASKRTPEGAYRLENEFVCLIARA